MEEKKLQHIKWFVAGLFLITLVVGGVCVLDGKNTGKSSVPSTDPETGIQEWIDAVNQRNIDRVYDLAPDEVKQKMTLAQLKEDNLNNTLLQPGYYFINYSVVDKKQMTGTSARIKAQVYLHETANPQYTSGLEVPLQFEFALDYQHGEWKIWTIPYGT